MLAMLTAAELAGRIDHTLLKPEADAAAIDRLCDEAVQHAFASACINGRFVRQAVKRLAASGVKTCSVVGFPLGAMDPVVKSVECARACENGADEIDFVASLPPLLQRQINQAVDEWGMIVQSAQQANKNVKVKVILETAALVSGVDDSEAESRIGAACEAARLSGCDFVKTSTGFHSAGGATVRAVQLMRKHGDRLQVKASGGMRTTADAMAMLEAGADRLGCSASIAIVNGVGAGDREKATS